MPQQRSEETRLKLSRLPHRKTLNEFDFSFQPSIDTRLMNELATLAFAVATSPTYMLSVKARRSCNQNQTLRDLEISEDLYRVHRAAQ